MRPMRHGAASFNRLNDRRIFTFAYVFLLSIGMRCNIINVMCFIKHITIAIGARRSGGRRGSRGDVDPLVVVGASSITPKTARQGRGTRRALRTRKNRLTGRI